MVLTLSPPARQFADGGAMRSLALGPPHHSGTRPRTAFDMSMTKGLLLVHLRTKAALCLDIAW
jgi:hypothetical protein